ncbi:MAG: APH(3') family aminoglycoside O-phosphotransferase [Acidimicrobiales bacterium]
MSAPLPLSTPLPEPVAALVADRQLHEVTLGRSGCRVVRADADAGAHIWYVKVAVDPDGEVASTLADEAERLRWLAPHLSVPAVVHHGCDADAEWLITEALPGTDATQPEHQGDPVRLVRLFAEGLRRLHDSVSVDSCPFDASTATLLERAASRVHAGVVDESDFDPIFHGLSARDLLGHLEQRRPADPDDLVVTHGDYCLPNLVLDRGRITGYLDVGRLGVGDRYRDVAVAARSVAYNLGAHAVGPFVDAYGIDWPDLARIDYFVMLDEMF